ncbi:MAG: adenosylcobinamide-GDP ribazoletransferase [Pseudomonadota bacterium]
MTKNDISRFSGWDILLALVLLTRLPIPPLPDPVFERQSNSGWAFPLVGLTVSALACLIGAVCFHLGLHPVAAAGLIVALIIAQTGAMHEDGLADTADGLWGGADRDRRLEIMKDSHIGTYGVLALILSVLLRVTAISILIPTTGFAPVLAGAIWSRALMPPVMAGLPHARSSGLSHSVGYPPLPCWATGLGLGFALMVLLTGISSIGPALLAAMAAGTVAWIARLKIGGQTGDILGATQQAAEIVFLLALAAQV